MMLSDICTPYDCLMICKCKSVWSEAGEGTLSVCLHVCGPGPAPALTVPGDACVQQALCIMAGVVKAQEFSQHLLKMMKNLRGFSSQNAEKYYRVLAISQNVLASYHHPLQVLLPSHETQSICRTSTSFACSSCGFTDYKETSSIRGTCPLQGTRVALPRSSWQPIS